MGPSLSPCWETWGLFLRYELRRLGWTVEGRSGNFCAGALMGSLEFLFLIIFPTDLPWGQLHSGFPTLVPAALCPTDSLLHWAMPPCSLSASPSWGLWFALHHHFSYKSKKGCWYLSFYLLSEWGPNVQPPYMEKQKPNVSFSFLEFCSV